MENNKFTTEIYSIKQLDKHRFIIPAYQRPYVWSDEQINKLLSDFYEAFSRNDEYYYIGTILLKEQKQNLFQLIDGQQRFTTLWLIAVAFKILNKNSDFDKSFLKVGDELRLDFAIRKQIKSYLLSLMEKQANAQNQYLDSEIENDDYLVHIAEAITIIVSQLQSLQFDNSRDSSRMLQDFGNYIFEKIYFVVNTVPQNTDLNKLFTTINNSGVQLEQHDILKSLLLKKIITGKEVYSRMWEACENMNNYFERNVKQLFPTEFDWTSLKHDDLKIFPTLNNTDKSKPQSTNNALTIDDILKIDNVCNLKVDLRKTMKISNFKVSDIEKISAKFYGSWIGAETEAESIVIDRLSNNNIKVQLHFFSSDKYAKGIELELTQNEQDAEAKINWAKASKRRNDKNKNLLGKDWNDEELEDVPIANHRNGYGYGISELIINPDTNNNNMVNSNNPTSLDDTNVYCRSIIKFSQLLLHAYRIFLKQQDKSDFESPFHSNNLLRIFKPLTDETNQETVKDFFKCLWTVRFAFDKHIVKWRQIDDDKEEELFLTSVSKSDNSFSRTNQTEPSDVSMLQTMLYHTGNYNTQIWLTPYLKQLIDDGENTLACLENIDNKLSINTLSENETAKKVSFELMSNSTIAGNISEISNYLEQSNGTSFRHYWFQKLEYVLWKEFSKDDKWKNTKKFKDYRITSKNSVEHVFPQNHEFGNQTIDKQHLNDFGNLALLNVRQNSSYSNQDVQKKKVDFNYKPTFDSLKLALIYEKDMASYDGKAIEEHRNEMIDKIKEHYSHNN
jgi:hypothetical protein